MKPPAVILHLLGLLAGLGLLLGQPATPAAGAVSHPGTMPASGLITPRWLATAPLTPTAPAVGAAQITAVSVEAFPALTAYLAVNTAAGQHAGQLPASAFALFENTRPVAPADLSVTEQETGLQLVFALDTSTAFKTRDVNAVTRLAYIKQALTAFSTQAAPRIRDGLDDITVLTPEGILASHLSQGSAIAGALATYTTTFAGGADPLPLVNQALDFASETPPRLGLPRYVVLFSNGLVRNGQAVPLDDLVARAQAAQVTFETVYIGPGGSSEGPGGQSLRRLANLTGGDFLALEKPDALTPLLQHLADQRLHYLLGYRSAISLTGQNTLTAAVTLADGSRLVSSSASFPLRVEPPAVSLPGVPATLDLPSPTAASAAITYSVPVAVDFPDGHVRVLQRLQLLVDGQLMAEQPAGPLAWNLETYASNGNHTLVVRVTDELGFIVESAPVTVALSFSATPVVAAPTVAPVAAAPLRPAVATVLASPPTDNRWVTGLRVAGIALLVLALGLGGLWTAQSLRKTPRRQPLSSVEPPGHSTLPLPTAPLVPARPAAFSFFPARRHPAPPKALSRAYLEIVEGAGGPRPPVEMPGPTLRLGRDTARAEAVFQDRSVSRLHARIVEEPEGRFRIYDEGSTSGTWVNFTQIPAESGWELKSGDLINLGRVQLRFRQRGGPPGAAKPPAVPLPPKEVGAEGETEPYHPEKP